MLGSTSTNGQMSSVTSAALAPAIGGSTSIQANADKKLSAAADHLSALMSDPRVERITSILRTLGNLPQATTVGAEQTDIAISTALLDVRREYALLIGELELEKQKNDALATCLTQMQKERDIAITAAKVAKTRAATSLKTRTTQMQKEIDAANAAVTNATASRARAKIHVATHIAEDMEIKSGGGWSEAQRKERVDSLLVADKAAIALVVQTVGSSSFSADTVAEIVEAVLDNIGGRCYHLATDVKLWVAKSPTYYHDHLSGSLKVSRPDLKMYEYRHNCGGWQLAFSSSPSRLMTAVEEVKRVLDKILRAMHLEESIEREATARSAAARGLTNASVANAATATSVMVNQYRGHTHSRDPVGLVPRHGLNALNNKKLFS